MNTDQAARRLEALGNVTRLEIYRLLVQAGPDGLPVGAILRHLGIPGSTLSHHVGKLIWVGLVAQERRGRVLICRAVYEAMNETLAFLTEECCAGVVRPSREGAA